MGSFVFNINKGAVADKLRRVNDDDPSTSVLVIAAIASSGVESDATLLDKDDFAALVSGATNFATNTGLSRKVLDEGDGITVTVDDTNDWVVADIANQTWTSVANDGTGAVSDLVTGFDDDSGNGDDSDISPLTFHDFSVTPNGGDITATIADFFKAA